MSRSQNTQIVFAFIVAILVTGLGLLAYDTGIVRPGFARLEPAGQFGDLAVGTGRFTTIYGTIATANQPNITNLGTQTQLTATTGTITNATVTTATITSLSLNGATFSGPIRFGSAAVYTTSTSIAHSFTTTPTWCLLWPTRDITSTYTITATGFSSNRSTQSETVYWACGK
jgi:hypothetical protein